MPESAISPAATQARAAQVTTINSPQSPSRTPTPAAPTTSSSRSRNPVPPSPLSRISTDPQVLPRITGPKEGLQPPIIENGGSAPPRRSLSFQDPQPSPCFIHSHLDRHGSLQDWLRNKGNQPQHHSNQPTQSSGSPGPRSPPSTSNASLLNGLPNRQAPHHTHRQAGHHPYIPPTHRQHQHSQPSSTRSAISPTGKDGSQNGYESDRSSLGNGQSTTFDNDLIDEDEELGSLTRQLAETAQGVREMSKELGRTRVRSRIQHVLIVTKARDNRLIKLTRELALYLMNKTPANLSENQRPGSEQRGMVVYVDAQLRSSKRFDAAGMHRDFPHLFQPIQRRRSSSSASISTLSAVSSTSSMTDWGKKRDEGQLRYWTSEMCSNSPQLFDFVVTLGGDGTVLFTSWLFQKIVPPVLPFALGSLGFLTNFDFSSYKPTMDKVIDDGIRVNLRMRFTCVVYRAIAPEEDQTSKEQGGKRKAIKRPGGEILMSQVDKGGWEALEGQSNTPSHCGTKDKEIMCFSTRPVEQFEVLNDLVVDRGPSPYVSLLELFGDEHHLTTVQADGLTVSTPTGSTAYSLSAGGSLVHPQIPALLITPICPHTLSFRPMLLPDSMELRICVPYNSRSTAWASFDGRGRVELKQGDHIKVTASKYPFPTVCADKQSTDWFNSISRTLRWNEREKQKSFVVVEEDHAVPEGKIPKKKERFASSKAAEKVASNSTARDETHQEEDEESEENEEDSAKVKDDDDEDDEEFDIDDKSGGDTTPSSPPTVPSSSQPPPPIKNTHAASFSHKSGVDSPDRYMTHYSAPPPLSQRHLVDALASAEISGKDGEQGQRDDIRNADENAFRVEGKHSIPSGRGLRESPSDGKQEDGHTPRAKVHGRRRSSTFQSRRRASSEGRNQEGKAKAFAFFGQDDSASDQSDNPSE